MPLHWSIVFSIHVLVCAVVSLFQYRGVETGSIHLNRQSSNNWWNCVAMAGVCILPAVFLVAMGWHAKEFLLQPTQMPSNVFLKSFLFMAALSPATFLIAFLLFKREYYFTPRHVFLFYLSGFTLTIAFFGSEYFIGRLFDSFAVSADRSLFFSYIDEKRFRHWMKFFLIGAGFLPLIAYQVTAGKGLDFIRRNVFTLFACIIIVLNCALVIGESNYLITGLGKWAFKYNRFGVFRALTYIQSVRTPNYILMPDILEKLAELEYQQGNKAGAKKKFIEIVGKYGEWPSHKRLMGKINHMLDFWNDTPKYSDSLTLSLEVPIVENADYLTLDWYGVLSAVAFRNPGLSDLQLKEKLLEIFSLEEHQLPLIESMPALIGALKRLQTSNRAAFLDTGKLLSALRKGYIPLVFYNNAWIPIVGYDAVRNGFYYYEYFYNYGKRPSFFSAGDTRLIFKGGSRGGVPVKGNWKKYTYQRFFTSRELSQHILNIGGIGLFICDSAFIPENESRAAYLIELGDFYYQEKNNFSRAARCYAESRRLSENWIVLERIAFLKRHYQQRSLSRKGLVKLFTPPRSPSWQDSLFLTDSLFNKLDRRIRGGKAGWYILEQWPLSKSGRDSAFVRELIGVYEQLHKENPHSIVYLDSLARLNGELGYIEKSISYYERLLSMSAGTNSIIAMQLAWKKLLNRQIPELKNLLKLCRPEDSRAKYLTLEAALSLQQGKVRRALKQLKMSLKEDKTLGETHRLAALCYAKLDNDVMRRHHETWYRRCLGEI